MMTQEHNYYAPKVGIAKVGCQRQSSYGNHQTKRNSCTSQAKNRLGPYTTTHPTAQIKALDMLNLKPSDVLFDLGAGDGRLIVMALQDAIEQEIEEHRTMLLSKSPSRGITWDRFRCDERNEECLMGECCHVKRRHSTKSRESKDDVGNPLTLQYCHSAPSIQGDSLLDIEDEGHRRNHSFESFALPHLMRNSSNDSNFDDILDDLSTDDFDLAVQHRTSWTTAVPTPYDTPDDKSPITPLISNRKTFNNEDAPKTNQPPLGLSQVERNTVCPDASKLDELKTIHLPKIFDAGLNGNDSKEKLRCVGIELDESLADRARSMVEKAISKYQNETFCDSNLADRVFIRCADILDEWIRDIDVDASKSAENLTLLDDATAVFVYLSTEGLKKIKPLLFEAALRRRRSQGEMGEFKRCDSVQQWKDILGQIHKQQPEVVDELELLDIEDKLPIDSISKTHQSRISDITTCESVWDGRCQVNSDSFDHKEDDTQKLLVGSPLTTNMQSTISSLPTSASLFASPFRVVSYMHPIPGWKATRIDRSSCGGCPLYYYEDIDMQDEY